MEERIENVDRISTLPEPTLQQIMSYLSFKQVVQTGTLSKSWQQAWRTFPVLKFDQDYFPKHLWGERFFYCDKEKAVICKRKRQESFSYLEQTLQKYYSDRTRINKFTLQLVLYDDVECTLFADRCIFYATQCNVRELNVNLAPSYIVPKLLSHSKSIEKLVLFRGKIESLRLSSLRKLHLSKVYLDEQVIEEIATGTGCPLIEDLSLSWCQGFKNLRLFGPSNLKKITVNENIGLEHMEIAALSFLSVHIMGWTIPQEIKIAYYMNLKYLGFCQVFIEEEWLCNQISKFQFLECLSLYNCEKLKSIKISSPCLKTLSIGCCEQLVEVKIETPKLSIFKYSGDVIFFSFDALNLLKTDLRFESKNMGTRWFAKYIKLLGMFHQFSEVLNLHCNRGQNAIVPGELRQILPPPLLGVKHLSFSYYFWQSFPIAEVVDGLLWISPHAESMCIEVGSIPKKFCFEFSYKHQLITHEGEKSCCCKSLPVLCWKQCIEKVKVEMTVGSLQRVNHVKRYTFEGEDIWKNIFVEFGGKYIE